MIMIMITKIKIEIAKIVIANVNSVSMYNDTFSHCENMAIL